MKTELFEALSPVCPRCLHADQTEAPLIIAERIEERAGHLWHGMLHCSNQACWTEFPVIDGIPILVTDPQDFIRRAQAQVLTRADLAPSLTGLIGDALGQGAEFERDRQHLSLYAHAHFSDWAGQGPSALAAIAEQAMAALPSTDASGAGDPKDDGPAVDLGCSVGRGTWELAVDRPALGLDLNFSMLRLAQHLMVEGRATYPSRRIGLAYDWIDVTLPDTAAARQVDFWAVDVMTLPFRPGTFGRATAINLVDCIAGPANMLHEAARVLAPGAGAVFTTPYDWAETATEKVQWMGGHSDRGPHKGAGEPVLTATLNQLGLTPIAEQTDIPWTLRVQIPMKAIPSWSAHRLAIAVEALGAGEFSCMGHGGEYLSFR